MQDLDDNALLREYVDHGSEKAFSALVARHINKVYSVALRHTRNPAQAEEITQAVFVILARKSRSLGRGVIVSGWLYQTARLTAVSSIRGEIRRFRREQEAHMANTVNESESDSWKQIAPLLDAALSDLNERDRHAVVLRYLDDKSMKEIAELVGGTESAVKMRLNRALEKLRLFLMRRGVVVPTAVLAALLSANCVQAAPVALVTVTSANALTQGATVGASTVALIEGALKMMAWAKLKTAIIIGVAVVLTTGTSLVLVQAVHSARVATYPDISGAWEGVIHFDDPGAQSDDLTRSRIILKFVRTNGVYTATSDWIEMGRRDVPIGKVRYDHPALRFERNPRDTWNLKVNPEATQMILDHALHFTEPDPVLFRRTTSPPQVPERLADHEFVPRSGSALQGYWKGELGPDALPVSVKIAEQSDGTFRAEGDIAVQGIYGRPVSVTCDPPTVKLIPATGTGMFQGEINPAHSQILGSWLQGGETVPAVLKRADYQAERLQVAEESYMFSSPTELQGHWRGTWNLRFGTADVKMRFALDIARFPNGAYYATLCNIDQFGNDGPMPTSEFQYTPPALHMQWKWAGGAFKGKLVNGKLIGVWEQGGGGFPLTFERAKAK